MCQLSPFTLYEELKFKNMKGRDKNFQKPFSKIKNSNVMAKITDGSWQPTTKVI